VAFGSGTGEGGTSRVQTGILLGQIAAVLGVTVGGVWGATQWTAHVTLPHGLNCLVQGKTGFRLRGAAMGNAERHTSCSLRGGLERAWHVYVCRPRRARANA